MKRSVSLWHKNGVLSAGVVPADPSAPLPDLTAPSKTGQTLSVCLITLAVGALGFRLWTGFCFFPQIEWNLIRLTPTFMIAAGLPVYPGIDGGALTTWIYGPVPLLLNAPALWATDAIGALYWAGIVNLLIVVVPLAFATITLERGNLNHALWAFLAGLALWPNASLHYIQSDNSAVAWGLISMSLLTRSRGAAGRVSLLAAAIVALAIWSKQTAVSVLLAQCVWIGCIAGWSRALHYAITSGIICTVMAGVFAGWFGAGNLWLNLVQIPGNMPHVDDLFERLWAFRLHLAGWVVLPALAAVIARRGIWDRDSPWLLPFIIWAATLPLGLLGAVNVGGATNSLYGALFLLPIAATALIRFLSTKLGHSWQAILLGGIGITVGAQIAAMPLAPLQPRVQHLIEAEQLAQQFTGKLFFPWHPLVTFFAEDRIDHTEDGLYTRRVTGFDPTAETVRAHLPPQWSMTAIPGWRIQGDYTRWQPTDAQIGSFGDWTVYHWENPTPTE